MKNLSSRLSFIVDQVLEGEPLWDIGCDHGLVGFNAYFKKGVSEVHFVDPSKRSLNKAQVYLSGLKSQFTNLNLKRFKFYQQRAETLDWSFVTGTAVMAGVGGRTITSMLSSIPKEYVEGIKFVLHPETEALRVEEFCKVNLKNHHLAVTSITEGKRLRKLLILTPKIFDFN